MSTPARYFIAVAQHGSIRGAAEELLVAPSAVSRQIRILERDLGARLFERTASGMELTVEGQQVLTYLLEAELREESLRDALSPGRVDDIVLRVGLLEGLIRLVPALDKRLAVQSPQIRLQAFVGGSQDNEQRLLDGRLDAGFVSGHGHSSALRIVSTHRLPLYLMVGRTHPLAERDSVPLDALTPYPFVLPDENFGIRREVDRVCAAVGIRLDVRAEANSIALILALITTGRLATFMTESALPEDFMTPDIRVISVESKRFDAIPIQLAVPRSRRDRATELAQAILSVMLDDPGSPGMSWK